MMMFCTKCGYQNEDRALFCARCGKPIKPVDSTQQDLRVKRRNSRILPVIISVVCVIALVVGIVRFALGGNGENASPIQSGAVVSPHSSSSTGTDKAPEPVKEVEPPKESDFPNTPVSDFDYIFDAELGGVVITNYKGQNALKVRFPDTIEGETVVGIYCRGGQHSFPNNPWSSASFMTAYIPDTVKVIGNYAFEHAEITSLTIPDSVTKIESGAFSLCEGLTSVTIPDSVTEIYGFGGCSKLNNVILGNGLTKLGGFDSCDSLTEISIPNSVTELNGFANCSGLTSVTIPDSVTVIGNDAFRYCTGLTSVTIGNGVTEIGGSPFNGCTSLSSVTIPESVTSIENGTFRDCPLDQATRQRILEIEPEFYFY